MLIHRHLETFDQLGGRFNSEFGLEAFPHLATVKYYCNDEALLYPQSMLLDLHNKAAGHERRIAIYTVENFRSRTDLRGFIHLTQLAQMEALHFGFRGWRKRWGMERLCGGALVWQLNDCWPGTSWSIVDYFLRKKPAYYAMARALAPLAIGVQRSHHDWSIAHARPPKSSEFELWAVSSHLEQVKVTVELRFICISTGMDLKPCLLRHNVLLAPNSTTPITNGTIDNVRDGPHILAARLWFEGKIVARDMDWPQPLKYLSFTDRGLTVLTEGEKVHVTVTKPVKGLVFEETDGLCYEDNAIDVAPGDVRIITVQGLSTAAAPLVWTYLGDDE